VVATPSVGLREAGTSNGIRRPVRRRIGLSHVLVAVAALLAFIFNFLALQNREATVMVAVVDTEVAAGSVFTADMVRLEPIPAGFSGLDRLITDADMGVVEGSVVTRSLAPGQLVDRGFLASGGGHVGWRSMSIPVSVEHAVGGRMTVGDRVDVISVTDGDPEYVASGLEVVDLRPVDSGGLTGSGPFFIVVGVTSDQALALAAAIDAGSIEVIRSTGASPSVGSG
jgi:SAF domain